MPFITQGKTNLKYILIVIVLAIIAGGGILFYYYSWIADLDARLAQIELKLPEVKRPGDETANWKTYRNEKYELYGYEIKHPAGWYVDEFDAGFGAIHFRNVSKEDYENIRREGKTNNIQEIVIQYKTEYSSVDEWMEGDKKSYLDLGISEELVSVKEITIGAEKGYKMTVPKYLPSPIALFKEGRGYLVMGQFLPEECRSGECEVFSQMLSTFKFLE